MARIRSLHPGLFSDENFMVLTVESPLAAVFLTGLWTEADDEGVFEWKPLTLKARVLPAISCSVEPLLAILEENRFVMRFEVDGRSYGAVRNFTRWQRPKKPKATHPKTEQVRNYVGLTSSSVGNQFGTGGELDHDDSSEVPNMAEPVGNQFGTGGEIPPQREDGGCRREEVIPPIAPPSGVADDEAISTDQPSKAGIASASAKVCTPSKASKRGTRIDPAWKPSDEDRAFAVSVGIPEREIERHGAEFRDYWAGVGGAKGVKLDWPATWRNRCRQIAEHKGYRPPAGAPAVHGSPPASPPGWPTDLPDPERLFAIWSAGRWSQAAWGFPPGDPSCRIPPNIVSEWQKRRQEAA